MKRGKPLTDRKQYRVGGSRKAEAIPVLRSGPPVRRLLRLTLSGRRRWLLSQLIDGNLRRPSPAFERGIPPSPQEG
ncbi:MAG: hypothetical protein NZ703_09165 [Gemmataceae bacterium]|nr:hypothetical protein [Gemmataceae bacterium]MCS7271243.1 hypothetical protein [Gemmataceae bacterium]MDW8241873.1 hypothetical protein [Thermogemmata sp.]